MIPRFRAWLPDVQKMLRVKALVYEEEKTRCVCGYVWTGDEEIVGNVYQTPELLEANHD